MADSGVGRRHMIEASFFPNSIAERAPHDQPHHQFDAFGSGIAEIFDMRYTGEAVCIARQVVEKRLVEVAVDQAGPRSLKLVAHPPVPHTWTLRLSGKLSTAFLRAAPRA